MCGKENLINIRHDPYAKQSNLVCLVETNLHQNEVFNWAGRKSFSHASCGRGSGVYAFAKQVLENSPYQFVKKKVSKRFQILQLKMTETKTIDFLDIVQDKFQIFILYVSHDQDSLHVANAIKEMILDDLPIIVIGDFNFDSEEKGNKLSEYLKGTLQLEQIVSGPTFSTW